MPKMKQVVRDARGLAHQPGAAGPAASHTLVKFKKKNKNKFNLGININY